jgi:hypothetical protein
MTDYLEKYGVKNYRKFQEGGQAGPPPAEGGAPPAEGGGGGQDQAMVQEAAQLVMQLADAAMQGDPQAGEIVVQIAQAVAGGGGGAEGGAPPPAAAQGSMVYRKGGKIGGPVFGKRATLIPRKS